MQLEGHTGPIKTVSAVGKSDKVTVVSGSQDQVLKVWEVRLLDATLSDLIRFLFKSPLVNVCIHWQATQVLSKTAISTQTEILSSVVLGMDLSSFGCYLMKTMTLQPKKQKETESEGRWKQLINSRLGIPISI